MLQLLRFGCSYEAIADTTCSATTIHNRRDEWIQTNARTADRDHHLTAPPVSRARLRACALGPGPQKAGPTLEGKCP